LLTPDGTHGGNAGIKADSSLTGILGWDVWAASYASGSMVFQYVYNTQSSFLSGTVAATSQSSDTLAQISGVITTTHAGNLAISAHPTLNGGPVTVNFGSYLEVIQLA